MEEANEVQETLSRSYGTPDIDEDELEAGRWYNVYVCQSKGYAPEYSWLGLVFATELDALGDELLLDDDSSYLDEASSAPSIPEGMPSDSKTNKVRLISVKSRFVSFTIFVSFRFTAHLTVPDIFRSSVQWLCLFLRMVFWLMSLDCHRFQPRRLRRTLQDLFLDFRILYIWHLRVVCKEIFTWWVTEAFAIQACGLVVLFPFMCWFFSYWQIY